MLRDVDQLAMSIQKVGLLEPVTVADTGDGRYRLFEGARRLAAMRQLRRKTIPALVRAVDETHRGLLQLTVHAQRLDFDPIAQAHAIAFELFERPGRKLSREEVAEAVGKGTAWVVGRLQLLKLTAAEQTSVSAGRLSVTNALQLLRSREGPVRPPARRPPNATAVTAPRAAVVSPSVVALRRIRALVGNCVGCSCCLAVAGIVDEAS